MAATDAFGNARLGEDFEDLALREECVVESELEGLRMTFGQQRAGHARRSAARQREFLADGKMRDARQNDFLGHAADVGGSRGEQVETGQVEYVELANHSERDALGRAGMLCEAKPNGLAGGPCFACGNRAQNV